MWTRLLKHLLRTAFSGRCIKILPASFSTEHEPISSSVISAWISAALPRRLGALSAFRRWALPALCCCFFLAMIRAFLLEGEWDLRIPSGWSSELGRVGDSREGEMTPRWVARHCSDACSQKAFGRCCVHLLLPSSMAGSVLPHAPSQCPGHSQSFWLFEPLGVAREPSEVRWSLTEGHPPDSPGPRRGGCSPIGSSSGEVERPLSGSLGPSF
mmetsp:Transcript_36993/g.98297  ORF Transcript_36993/g.98297 Transcript_36993/m.98297 type:complete len:213 (+) Transcript_36993:1701-2339(+)